MADNPLKYRELIEPDDSIENAIKQLTVLGDTYDKMLGKVRTEATALEATIKGVSGATETQRETIKKTYAEVDKLTKAQRDLTQAQSTQAAQIASLKALQQEQNAVNKLTAQFNNNVEGSYNRLSATYALNKIKINQMSQAWRETTNEGKLFVAETNEIYQKMIQMQEITGKHTLSVGNYSKATAGLGRSISMMASELPNAAQSMRIFIMSLSNNWMQLAQSIQQVQAEQKELTKQFKAGLIDTKPDGMIKQLMKSMLSFNVLLMVGVTLFSLYGEKIINWIGDLFKGENAVRTFTSKLYGLNTAHETINKTMKDGGGVYGDTVKSIEEMNVQLSAAKGNHHEETLALDKYNKGLGENFGKATSVGQALDIIASKKDAYIDAMMQMAYANAFLAQSQKDMVAYVDAQTKSQQEILRNAGENGKKLWEEYAKLGESINTVTKFLEENKNSEDKGIQDRVITVSKHLTWLENERQKTAIKITTIETTERKKQLEIIAAHQGTMSKEYQKYYKLYLKELEAAGIKSGDIENKQSKVYHDYQVKEFDWTEKMNESLAKTMADGRNKEIENLKISIDKKTGIVDTYIENLKLQQAKIQETLDQTKDPKVKTQAQNDLNKVKAKIESSELLKTSLVNQYEEERKKGIQDIDDKYDLIAITKRKAQIEIELGLVQDGSEKEQELKLMLLEQTRKEELIKNRQEITEKRQDESLINKKYDRLILEQSTKFNTEKSLLLFDAQQRDEKTEFDRINHTEKEKTRFRLQAEKDRWEKILSLNETAGIKLSDKEVSQIKDTIAKINGELKTNEGKKGKEDIYSLMGLNLDDDSKQAISDSTSFAINQLQDILAANVELASKAVDASNTAVETKKSNLDKEIEARNNGYASNVSAATAEYNAAKKIQDKALKDKAQAVKQQQQLDALLQTGSLITASANIWKSLSAIPVIGVGLALSALGVMWGSFAASKVKAAQVAQTTYGEGGFEVLEGGSHQSGNDIPIGRTRDGRDRRAEGGEMLAVIKRSSTQRYRRILPDIINSLNHGVFESKYLNAYATGGMAININSPATNIKELENDVREIRTQGERRYYTDGKGQVIEIYKNLKRTMK